MAALAPLTAPVDPARDHVRGPADARITLVEYADFQCPYCRQAYPVVHELLARFEGQLRFVFRHMPLTDLHPAAQRAAEAAEAAAAQGAFWAMHDRLYEEHAFAPRDLVAHARALGLDAERFSSEIEAGLHRERVLEDLRSGVAGGVPSTPRFYVDGAMHTGTASFRDLEWAIGASLEQSSSA